MRIMDFVLEYQRQKENEIRQKEQEIYLFGLEEVLKDINEGMPNYQEMINVIKDRMLGKDLFVSYQPSARTLAEYEQEIRAMETAKVESIDFKRKNYFIPGETLLLLEDYEKFAAGTIMTYNSNCRDNSEKIHGQLPGADGEVHVLTKLVALIKPHPMPVKEIQEQLTKIREDTEQSYDLPYLIQWREVTIKEAIGRMRELQFEKVHISLFFVEHIKDRSYIGDWVRDTQ